MSSLCLCVALRCVASRIVARMSWRTRGLVTPGWYRMDGGLEPRPPRSVYSGTMTSVMTPLMPWMMPFSAMMSGSTTSRPAHIQGRVTQASRV